MFGNKKMYKKGAADAMQAYEGFAKKQGEALEELRKQVEAGDKKLEDALSQLNGKLYGIADYLTEQEKKALYHLNTPIDIKEMEDSEKHLLVAVLCQLAQNEGPSLTASQQTYISSVQQYLGITNPEAGADLSVVSDIDSLETQRAFMQTVLEFFYLQDSDEITDAQEDFLSNFSVNKKQALSIDAHVSALYNALGEKGLAEKYGPVNTAPAKPEIPSDEAIKEQVKKVQLAVDKISEDFTYIGRFYYGDYDIDSLSVGTWDDKAYKKSSQRDQAAHTIVDRLWRQFQRAASAYMKKTGEDSVYAYYKESFDDRIDNIKEKLDSIRQWAGAINNTNALNVIDKMSALLKTSDFYSKISSTTESLVSKHSFPGSSHFYSDVDYSQDCMAGDGDGIIAHMIAVTLYGFDAYPATRSMNEECETIIQSYADDLNNAWISLAQNMYANKLDDLVYSLSDALHGYGEEK